MILLAIGVAVRLACLRASYAARDLGAWKTWTMRVPILGVTRVVALGYPNPRLPATLATIAVALWALWRTRQSPDPVLVAAGALTVHVYFCLSVQVIDATVVLAFVNVAALVWHARRFAASAT